MFAIPQEQRFVIQKLPNTTTICCLCGPELSSFAGILSSADFSRPCLRFRARGTLDLQVYGLSTRSLLQIDENQSTACTRSMARSSGWAPMKYRLPTSMRLKRSMPQVVVGMTRLSTMIFSGSSRSSKSLHQRDIRQPLIQSLGQCSLLY